MVSSSGASDVVVGGEVLRMFAPAGCLAGPLSERQNNNVCCKCTSRYRGSDAARAKLLLDDPGASDTCACILCAVWASGAIHGSWACAMKPPGEPTTDNTLAAASRSSFDVIMAADGVEFHQESTAFLVRAEHSIVRARMARPPAHDLTHCT